MVARLLLDPSQIPMFADKVAADDFYLDDMRAAYGAMLSLSQQNKPVDVITVRSESKRNERIDLSILDLTKAHGAPIEEYADIIRSLAVRRQVIEAAQQIIHAATAGRPDRMTEAAELAFELASTTSHDDALGLVDLGAFRAPPVPPILGVLSPEGTTVLYGDGGDGKGWIAAKWASQLDVKVAIIDFENHPNEWAYRLDKFGLQDVLYVSPPNTMERWANDRAARLLRNAGIGFLIVDSAMYASNVDDPYSPASAMAYKRARSRLDNLPAILLAHTTGGQDKVFGSVFWRNEARIVWRLNKDLLTRQRSLECRKANNYQDLEGKRFHIEFSEEHGILNLHPHGHPWTAQEEAA